MAQIAIFYDPGPGGGMSIDKQHYPRNMAMAAIDLPGGLGDRDLYEVARKLAELLLENMPDDGL